jgi:hypothetical protein
MLLYRRRRHRRARGPQIDATSIINLSARIDAFMDAFNSK